ncbi:Osmosensitive K+ channel histidine kinase KdpD [Fictibacillus macauensis ZFHKF-1]|uniref:Osmosensitive K+ channel histidine kinase KdpD n=1 Tax=Fictibacillus macauensis ZFHKF-1 TaxID=1196324 RepID=I8UFB4_9BACL|nr:Osmosensitive K+ channel histidine kinase KdpD [Fictibacillus macauensis ZFHKF-1]
MVPGYKRKTPEEILQEIEQLKYGKLKVYIGSAPGVGKTYRMLQEAHELVAEGVDVVIGIIETHNRKETADLVSSLEIIPKQQIQYKGHILEELDTEAIIKRAPDVVLVDELAHTNVPTSAREKRYMDVEKILQAGINVLSAVNIQHLESLHDIVEKITGVKVRERIPDSFLHTADEVILIDVTPEILRKRLKEGKIYHQSKIEQSLANFFTKGNLSSLRELSLREVADDVDERSEKAKLRDGQTGPIGTHEKIMVCVQHGGNAERLIRRGWRIASRLKTSLTILHVSNEASMNRSQEERKKIQDWKKLATQFNASFIVEQMNKRKISQVITDVAVSEKITQIILGQSARTRWEEIKKGSIVNNIMREATGIDIHIVSDQTKRG